MVSDGFFQPASLTFNVSGKQDLENDLRAIRAVHGGLDPLSVAGHRMGRRALELLGLPRGSRELVAIVRTPMDARYAAVADGIEAATGATMGRLSLLLEEARSLEEAASVFSNRSGGESLTLRLRPEFLERAASASGPDAEALALKVATMEDSEIFESSGLREASSPLVARLSVERLGLRSSKGD